MDGVLVIDKPAGPTSHDVVARARRILRERRVGHTGTLDPMATGVLPLVVGRATRLARFLSAGDKAYEAVVALGFATDTGDSSGTPIGDREASATIVMPGRDAIERALDRFRGSFLQQPPVYSAKKIGGQRSHRLARRAGSVPGSAPRSVPDSVPDSVLLRPVSVTAHRLELIRIDGNRVTLSLDCSAGFYVRSLAHDLGDRLGTGAHLAELRRTRSADYGVDVAMALEDAERDPAAAVSRVIPLSRMLPRLPAIALSADGVRRARHGQDVSPADTGKGVGSHFSSGPSKTTPNPFFRLLDPDGALVGIAEPAGRSGLLHPFVVLG